MANINSNNSSKLGKRIAEFPNNPNFQPCRKPQNAVVADNVSVSSVSSVPFTCDVSQIAVEETPSYSSKISSLGTHSFPQIAQVQSFNSNDANGLSEGFQIFEVDKTDPQNHNIGDNANISELERFIIISPKDTEFLSSDDDNPKPPNLDSIFRKKNNSIGYSIFRKRDDSV